MPARTDQAKYIAIHVAWIVGGLLLILLVAYLVMMIGASRDGDLKGLTTHIGVAGRDGNHEVLVDRSRLNASAPFIGGSIVVSDVATVERAGDWVIGRFREAGTPEPWFAIRDQEIVRDPDAVHRFASRDAAIAATR